MESFLQLYVFWRSGVFYVLLSKGGKLDSRFAFIARVQELLNQEVS